MRWSRVLVAFLLATLPALATDYTWNTTTGTWDTAGNWTPTGIPTAGDNAVISTGAVSLTGTQSIAEVTLTGGAVSGFGANFNLGGTMTLTAGNWTMGSVMDSPAVFTGGTITRGASATGTFTVTGDLRMVNTQINGNVLKFDQGGARLRLSGSASVTAGSTITFSSGTFAAGSGLLYESGGTLTNNTVNLGPNTTLGTFGGQTLTIGAGSTVVYNDPQTGSAPAAIGRDFYSPNTGVATLINQGTIRAIGGELYVGRFFDTGNNPANVDITNSGLIESKGFITIHANNFTNAPGGIVRATAGGGVFVFGRNSWVNNGTFDVTDGSSLDLGGLFTRAAIGTVTRSGTNTVGIYAGWMDNSGGTWALSPATGNYRLYGDGIASSGRIIGGSITATGGAKLEVRPHPGAYSGVDYCRLTGVAVGPGVLDFSATGGKVWLENGTTLANGDTITLAGTDTAVAYFQTQQVDGVTFALSGSGSAFSVYDNNVLTLGPTSVVRKTGTTTAGLVGGLFSQSTGTATAMVNSGLIHVQQGTLNVNQSAAFTVTNRGTVQVDAGATWQGALSTNGGTVQGGGAINGPLTFTGTGNHLRPGSSPGTLTVTGNIVLNSSTTFHAELNGNTPGTGHDQLAVTGTVTLGNAVLELILGTGYTPVAGDKLFLITNDSNDAIPDEFASMPDKGQIQIGNYFAKISYTGDSVSGATLGGNDVVLYDFTPVPEPTTILAAAAIGLLALRRRQQLFP